MRLHASVYILILVLMLDLRDLYAYILASVPIEGDRFLNGGSWGGEHLPSAWTK